MTALTERPAPPRRQALRRRSRREALWFWALAGPNVLLILVFTYRPLISNAYYSTLDWTLGSPTATPVGLGNYVEFFTSGSAGPVLTTTAVFGVATVGGSMLLGLLLALALNTKVTGSGLARAAVFSPYVLSGVGVGLVWLFIMDPVIGVLGAVLRAFGGSSPAWFNDPHLTLTMVVVVYVWKNLGYAAVVYLAGLQSIDPDVLEAAALDGAGPVRRLVSVVVPLLSPTTFFLLVTTALSSLQAFDLLKVMSPLGRGTDTLVYESYLQAFEGSNRAGYSAALSTVLFVLLAGLTLFQLLVLEKRVHYR
ncbi:carbohydrate ABC transporter permease [Quadrisphaera oryzae]|uniref:carbohydrate ABC transporter permease n=1 Tax=Quadrisphaera TaxID=317661 RepID=UPI001646DADD|nr:sugar ABC transporter permease [Quadrisphaera sp. RL12-1S]MBC3761217.1 sugar ABC transporter permease [Quadrisphaera sp. RL12-1S]